jgi:hypothetical protein
MLASQHAHDSWCFRSHQLHVRYIAADLGPLLHLPSPRVPAGSQHGGEGDRRVRSAGERYSGSLRTHSLFCSRVVNVDSSAKARVRRVGW